LCFDTISFWFVEHVYYLYSGGERGSVPYSFGDVVPVALSIGIGFITNGERHLPLQDYAPLAAMSMKWNLSYGLDIKEHRLM
jgi:hypothetical protein